MDDNEPLPTAAHKICHFYKQNITIQCYDTTYMQWEMFQILKRFKLYFKNKA